MYNALGDDTWGCALQPNALTTTVYTTQPLSSVVAFNRSMGAFAPWAWRSLAPVNNLLVCDNAFEMIDELAARRRRC